MKEIGSEYWTVECDDGDNNLDFLNVGRGFQLLMSGRTAIDFVLENINDLKKVVYMPDYCCKSMMQPFEDAGYTIKYYRCDLLNHSYSIDKNTDCSIFFAMSYFGYSESNMDEYIQSFDKRDIIVIEDITHRLLSDANHSEHSTYLVASLRKWFPIASGGVAISMKAPFLNGITDYSAHEEYIKAKETAMDLKQKYISNNTSEKSEYLNLFKKSDDLIDDYHKKKMDDKSIELLRKMDISTIREKRISNGRQIEDLLKSNSQVKLLFKYQEGDCPFFVPISVNNRDEIRQKLIDNQIYLPVHWPNELELNNELYDYELSLVCDQRYDSSDIENYISFLNSLFKE